MKYYFNKTLTGKTFEEAIQITTEALKQEGFGIVTEIDMQATFKKKLDKDIGKYVILGACNPSYAYRSVMAEDKIGLFLPCNVIVQGKENGAVEVSAVDPIASMSAVQNEALGSLATEVREKMKRAIEQL